MALQMLGRIVGGAEGSELRARALAIVTSLDDEALRLRFTVARAPQVQGPLAGGRKGAMPLA
jgi:hypothetical protein